jgi:hypothetical protein
MNTLIDNGGRCANCQRENLEVGMPVFKRHAQGGQGGFVIAIWCIDCVRRLLLHQEGEDEPVAGG